MDGHQVFVPMVGELFSITKMTYVTVRTEKEVFVPMVGELFSIIFEFPGIKVDNGYVFVPMVGELFSILKKKFLKLILELVFVPMVGELFSIHSHQRDNKCYWNCKFSSPWLGSFFQSVV